MVNPSKKKFFLQKTQPRKPQKVIRMLNKQLYTEGRLIISAHKKMNEKKLWVHDHDCNVLDLRQQI